MPEYEVSLVLRDVVISLTIVAESFDDALARAKKMQSPTAVFQPKRSIEFIEGGIEVKGVYEI